MSELPEPCEKCAEYGGYWTEYPNGGMGRCRCPRGLALREMERIAAMPPVPKPPVMSVHEAEVCVEALAGGMQFVPSGDNQFGRGAITSEIREMCADFDQAKEFVRRFSRMYRKWPGIAEMRWAFCAMGFKPLDCVQSVGDSELYPDGLPEAAGARPAAPPAALRDPRSRELPPGEAGIVLRAVIEKSRRL